ncbi:class I SAM-dependent methyltransferase [Bryobacter aggregatus]|uniref:class I SAM-dependent methyltransferase n=1 Tax=Bryobacter aggregatus TaxID=360054 RepID=UPI0004E1352A|nr:class I SAM-dependent methyltransferase [Bryobacter aggregatus]
MALPDPQPVLFLMEAFRRSQAMFTAVDLRVFDHLQHAPLGAAQLATLLKANPDAVERLCSTCVALDLLTLDNGLYANTPAAQTYLVRDSEHCLIGYIEYSQKALWHLWSKLPEAVLEGTHRWEQVYGSQSGLFDHYYKTEEDKRRFLMGMHAYGLISSPQVAKAFDLSAFTHLCDLGGATGHLAIAACQSDPKLKATVFDLEQVLPLSKEIIAKAGLSDRIGTAGGNFFEGALPPADLYSLGRILHDWTPEKITKLLRKIHAALPPGGAVLIAEKILDESGTKPLWALLQTLNMLVVTEGKERRFSEYQALLQETGFKDIRYAVLPNSPLDAILAWKNT